MLNRRETLLQDLLDEIGLLIEESDPYADILGRWLSVVEDEFAPPGGTGAPLVSEDLLEALFAELTDVQRALIRLISAMIRPNTRSIWLGLFEHANGSENELVLHVAGSHLTSEDDLEWESRDDLYLITQFKVDHLRRAQTMVLSDDADHKTAIQHLMPIAFCGAALYTAHRKMRLAQIEEYSFGWAEGDCIRWRPSDPEFPGLEIASEAD